MDSVCKERVKDEDVERWKGRGLNLAVPLFFAGHQSGTICSLEVLQLNFLGSDSLKIHLHTLPVLHIKREREGVNERIDLARCMLSQLLFRGRQKTSGTCELTTCYRKGNSK